MMLGNSWFKKEKPLTGLMGAGGGVGGKLLGGGPAFSPVTATGGYIHDFEDTDGKLYRCHIFINDGDLVVTDGGADINYLLVAGGGGAGKGGNGRGGGGGTSAYDGTQANFMGGGTDNEGDGWASLNYIGTVEVGTTVTKNTIITGSNTIKLTLSCDTVGIQTVQCRVS